MACKGIRQSNILEIATGSGSAAYFLKRDNNYVGVDISPGLLRRAYSRLRKSGFETVELFVGSADDLPFPDQQFDFAICHLSLNFFNDLEQFIKELKRVLKQRAVFYCSVPIPERKPAESTIHGNLRSENELKSIFESSGFKFTSQPHMNGALLYFSAVLLPE
jgi:ubiquinone/menaquinone biosynthesis C-methylase UbiE